MKFSGKTRSYISLVHNRNSTQIPQAVGKGKQEAVPGSRLGCWNHSHFSFLLHIGEEWQAPSPAKELVNDLVRRNLYI